MSKRSVFTTLTPLPAGITRETVMETLRDHLEMIDLNPLVEERHPIKPPPNATPEEYHCLWYSLTDRVQYLPGGMMSGKISYNACFHDLENGLQTHCYAPMGVNIKGKWILGGSLPGEPVAPVELGVGAPLTGLWLREDVDMKCNIMMTSFVKKTLKKAHSHLVDRLVIKAQIVDATLQNQQLSETTLAPFPWESSQASTEYSPSDYGDVDEIRPSSARLNHFSRQSLSTQNSGSTGGLGQALVDSNTIAHAQIQSAARSSSANNSWTSSPGPRNSYQDNRVSWQNLSQHRTSSPVPPRVDFQYKAYRESGPSYHAVELHSEERLKIGNQNYRGPAQKPTVFGGAVELE